MAAKGAFYSSFRYKYKHYGFLLLVILLFTRVNCESGCALNVSNLDNNTPVMINNSSRGFELVTTKNGVVHLQFAEELLLLCPGNKNYLTTTNSNVTVASCVRGNQLKIGKSILNMQEIQCKALSRPTIQQSKDNNCARYHGSEFYKIGYEIIRNAFLTVIGVCYNKYNTSTMFTEHLLQGGDHLDALIKMQHRPGFSTEFISEALSVAYKRTYQRATFSSILNSAKLAHQYINETSYLVRGHLTPVADMSLITSKLATFFYLNTFPQWQIINTSNWKRLENLLRKAVNYYTSFRMYTGTSGTLKLSNYRNELKEISLNPSGKIPVPEKIWKLVYEPQTKHAILFVVFNNPFVGKLGDAHAESIWSGSICERSGWSSKTWTNRENGFLVCLSYNSVYSHSLILPKLEVLDILQGPNI